METVGRTVDWIGKPIVVRRTLGTRSIDLAMVGRVREGIVIAFRGTLQPFFGGRHDGWAVLLDWLNDGLSLCVERPDYPGGVHMGFAASMDRLWEDEAGCAGLRSAVLHLLRQGARRHLFVTGHSKGGALANLFAWRAAAEPDWADMGVSVATIAAARAGNAAFAHAYDRSRIVCLRYELEGDPVPHLPPGPDSPRWALAFFRAFFPRLAGTDYRAVGIRMTPPETESWVQARLKRAGRLLSLRGVDWSALTPQLIAAHAICPKSGYDQLICTGEAQGCNHGR
jgi:hypothetical protein